MSRNSRAYPNHPQYHQPHDGQGLPHHINHYFIQAEHGRQPPPESSALNTVSRKVLPAFFVIFFLITGTIVMIYTAVLRRAVPRSPAIGLAITIATVITLIVLTRLMIYCRERWHLKYKDQKTEPKPKGNSHWDRFYWWLIKCEKRGLSLIFGEGKQQTNSSVESFRYSRGMGLFQNPQTEGRTYEPALGLGSPYGLEDAAASRVPAASQGQGEAQYTNPTVPEPAFTRPRSRSRSPEIYLRPKSSAQAQACNQPITTSRQFEQECNGVQQQAKLAQTHRDSRAIVYKGSTNRPHSVQAATLVHTKHSSTQTDLYQSSVRGSTLDNFKAELNDQANNVACNANRNSEPRASGKPTDPNDKKQSCPVLGAAAQDVKATRRTRAARGLVSRGLGVSGSRQGRSRLTKTSLGYKKAMEKINQELEEKELDELGNTLWKKPPSENKSAAEQSAKEQLAQQAVEKPLVEKLSAEKDLLEKELPLDG